MNECAQTIRSTIEPSQRQLRREDATANCFGPCHAPFAAYTHKLSKCLSFLIHKFICANFFHSFLSLHFHRGYKLNARSLIRFFFCSFRTFAMCIGLRVVDKAGLAHCVTRLAICFGSKCKTSRRASTHNSICIWCALARDFVFFFFVRFAADFFIFKLIVVRWTMKRRRSVADHLLFILLLSLFKCVTDTHTRANNRNENEQSDRSRNRWNENGKQRQPSPIASCSQTTRCKTKLT